VDRAASSRTLDGRQMLEPIVAIIVGDDRAPAAFSSSQSAFFNLRVSRRASDSITVAKLVDAHCSLPRAALSLGFGNFASRHDRSEYARTRACISGHLHDAQQSKPEIAVD
jgi:hypothetical protein